MTIFLILVFLLMMIPTSILGMGFAIQFDEGTIREMFVFFVMFLIPAIPTAMLGWIIWQRLTGGI